MLSHPPTFQWATRWTCPHPILAARPPLRGCPSRRHQRPGSSEGCRIKCWQPRAQWRQPGAAASSPDDVLPAFVFLWLGARSRVSSCNALACFHRLYLLHGVYCVRSGSVALLPFALCRVVPFGRGALRHVLRLVATCMATVRMEEGAACSGVPPRRGGVLSRERGERACHGAKELFSMSVLVPVSAHVRNST